MGKINITIKGKIFERLNEISKYNKMTIDQTIKLIIAQYIYNESHKRLRKTLEVYEKDFMMSADEMIQKLVNEFL